MSKKIANTRRGKIRYYVEQVDGKGAHNACLIVFIDEGDVHPRQTKHHVSASFECRIPRYSDFWLLDEYDGRIRNWCEKKALSLGLIDQLKEAIHADSRKGSK